MNRMAWAKTVSVILFLTGCLPIFAGSKEDVPWKLKTGRYGAAMVADGKTLYIIGGGDNVTFTLGDIEKIDLATGQVSETPMRIIPRRFHAAVLIGREIYVFGGESDEGLIASIEVVNLDTQKVRKMGRMPTPRRSLSAVMVEDLIFTLGGSAPDDRENLPRSTIVEVFDWQKNKWFHAPAMPTGKEVPAVFHDHYLYMLGGYNGEGRADSSCQRYDLSSGKWEPLAGISFTLSAYSAVNIGRAIVCFGDYEKLGRVVAYLPGKDAWRVLDIPFTPRRHSSVCLVDGWVYVVGGNGAAEGLSTGTIERYKVSDLEAAIVQGQAIH